MTRGEQVAEDMFETREDCGSYTSIRMKGAHQWCWHSSDRVLMLLRLSEQKRIVAAAIDAEISAARDAK